MSFNLNYLNSDCLDLPSTLEISGADYFNTSGCSCVADPYCLESWDWTLKKINLCYYENFGYDCYDTYPLFVSLRREQNVSLNGKFLSGLSWLLEFRCDLEDNSNIIWRGRLISKSPIGVYKRLYGCDLTENITISRPETTPIPPSVIVESDPLADFYYLVVSNFQACLQHNGAFKMSKYSNAKNLYYDLRSPKWHLKKINLPNSEHKWIISSQSCNFLCNDGNYARKKPYIWQQTINSEYPLGEYSFVASSACFEWNSDVYNLVSQASLTVSSL
jgi:hypothetical protein